MNANLRTAATKQLVYGQPSWRLAATGVEAFVTELGGHLGPVTFRRQGKPLQPYSITPWWNEKADPAMPNILQVLRGDFFCLPFGGNATSYKGEKHPVHGETSNARWRFQALQSADDRHCLHLSLRTKVRPGLVDKRIWLIDGHDAVYSQHVLSGMRGPMNLGHHAMLKFPEAPGSGRLSTSRFVYGQVFPQPFECPEKGGYSFLKQGAKFRSLAKVPTITGQHTDLTHYPARRGFEDLVMIVSDATLPFAWTAVTFPKERYVWFALKNPRVLRQTIFWLSNGGRYYAPWNGRHTAVLGLEEVTSYFHTGLAESARENPLSRRGIPTHLALNPAEPTVIPYIMGVARIPAGFDRVAAIRPVRGKPAIRLESGGGRSAEAVVDLGFLEASAGW